MIFDKNHRVFADCVMEKIWELGTRLLPLDLTLPYVPDELKTACADYYNFTYNLLADMYENPDSFGFVIDLAKNDHSNKGQVEFYFWFLGGHKEFRGNRQVLPSAAFHKLYNKFNPTSMKRLEKHGFVFEEANGEVIIQNTIYPEMLIGADAIGRAGYDNYKVNRDYFMMYCDFRAFAKYGRTYEDLHRNFGDTNLEAAQRIHEYCVSLKVMPQKCYYFYRAEYKHKGKMVYLSNISAQNKLLIYIGFAEIGGDGYRMIEQTVRQYEDFEEFADFCRRSFKKCSNCYEGCEKKHRSTDIFGKCTQICQPYFRIRDPREEDLRHIQRLIDLRVMLIKAGISEVFYPGNG